MKITTDIKVLCEGLPNELMEYLRYCRNLAFEEKPDYYYLKKILKERFVKEGYINDCVYDWHMIPYSKREEIHNIK